MGDIVSDGDISGYADFDNRATRTDGIDRAALKKLPVIDRSPFVRGGSAAL